MDLFVAGHSLQLSRESYPIGNQ